MKYEQLTFQPMSSPTNVTPRRSLDGDDLAEQDRGVLGQQVARLAGDGDAERPEVPGQDGRVGVEVDRLLLLRAPAPRARRRR